MKLNGGDHVIYYHNEKRYKEIFCWAEDGSDVSTSTRIHVLKPDCTDGESLPYIMLTESYTEKPCKFITTELPKSFVELFLKEMKLKRAK